MIEGFREKTDEERASEDLYDYFVKFTKVHCWHPPDSKSYFTLLLQVPNNNNAKKSGRDHIDLIIQKEKILMLLEVKGKLTESDKDITKLRRIRDTFTLNELVELFRQQGAKFENKPEELIIGIAARFVNCNAPDDLAVFKAGDGKVVCVGELANRFKAV